MLSYWYAEPGATDDIPQLHPSDLSVPHLVQLVEKQMPGTVIEGEGMTPLITEGVAPGINMQLFESDGYLWSGHFEIRWYDHTAPATIDFEFEVPEAGEYCVLLYSTRHPFGGRHDIDLNGTPALSDYDFCSIAGFVPTEEMPLGIHSLSQGTNTLHSATVGPTACGYDELSIDALALIDFGADAPLTLRFDRAELGWTHTAPSYDLVRGDLFALRAAGGAFGFAGLQCLASDIGQPAIASTDQPSAGEGWFYLVRARHCFVDTFDSGGSGQIAQRDDQIAACP